MDQVSRAATKEEIAAAAAKRTARQVLPDGFQAEKTIPLSVPIALDDGTTHTTISVRRLKGRDFLALQNMRGDQNVALLALVTGVPAEVIAELDAEDFVAVSEAAQDFLPRAFRGEAAPTSETGPATPQ